MSLVIPALGSLLRRAALASQPLGPGFVERLQMCFGSATRTNLQHLQHASRTANTNSIPSGTTCSVARQGTCSEAARSSSPKHYIPEMQAKQGQSVFSSSEDRGDQLNMAPASPSGHRERSEEETSHEAALCCLRRGLAASVVARTLPRQQVLKRNLQLQLLHLRLTSVISG